MKEARSSRVEIVVKRSGYVELSCFDDTPDGCLVIGEGGGSIPFEVKRFYYISGLGNPMAVRGRHAHRGLEQVIFAVNGSFSLLLDDGVTQQTVKMERPEVGVRLGKLLWHEMTEFSADCCILVVASDHYDEGDYIRDYNQFLRLIAEVS